MSSMLSACVTSLLLIGCVGLDVYILYETGLPVSKTIPCTDNECDFSVLQEIHIPDEEIDELAASWVEYLWFKNININVTEIYYCGNGMEGAVDLYPCNRYHIYFTLFLLNLLPILTILLFICCCSSSKSKYKYTPISPGAQAPPSYNDQSSVPKYEYGFESPTSAKS